MKLSIVIPIYNVEKYILKCLESCITEELGINYEIIVIDDGSPDNSADIASLFLQGRYGYKIIHQNNRGLSVARNVGLKEARGKYVWFIDADDYLTENAINVVLKSLNDDVDILELQYQLVYEEDGRTETVGKHIWDGVISGKEVMHNGGLSTAAQFTIYRRHFLIDNTLEFVKGIYHEDVEFKPRMLFFAEKCKSLDFVVYNYLQRETGSITSRFSLKRGVDSILIMNNLYKFAINNAHADKNVCQFFYRRIGVLMNSLLQGIVTLDNKDKSLLFDMLKSNNNVHKALINSGSVKYSLEGIALKISPKLTSVLYKFIF